MSLYIVATPIGNLGDMTQRAIQTLKDADLIAAEDTRHTKKLLDRYEIQTPTTSYHAHTKTHKLESLIEKLKEGQNIALVSDAGTPGISDPAYTLIQAALAEDIEIIPIPGPAAFLTALMGSGLPMNQFTYLGFIPAKKGRMTLFKSLKDETRTVIMYESPHRIMKTLTQMLEALGPDRTIVIARELTKLHETFHRGTLQQIHDEFTSKKPKGEMVVLVAPESFR